MTVGTDMRQILCFVIQDRGMDRLCFEPLLRVTPLAGKCCLNLVLLAVSEPPFRVALSGKISVAV